MAKSAMNPDRLEALLEGTRQPASDEERAILELRRNLEGLAPSGLNPMFWAVEAKVRDGLEQPSTSPARRSVALLPNRRRARELEETLVGRRMGSLKTVELARLAGNLASLPLIEPDVDFVEALERRLLQEAAATPVASLGIRGGDIRSRRIFRPSWVALGAAIAATLVMTLATVRLVTDPTFKQPAAIQGRPAIGLPVYAVPATGSLVGRSTSRGTRALVHAGLPAVTTKPGASTRPARAPNPSSGEGYGTEAFARSLVHRVSSGTLSAIPGGGG